jgi:hypothetical protein
VRLVCLYAPAVVLFAWAAILTLDLETRGVTVSGRILLGLTLGVHIRQELHDHRAK